ncbi:DUF6510 family protein [Kribbella sp. NPDC003557]|uniref:DUF6510 family protein n=1 Tax=Kribbella sp. NPDC003557 TaxID=3154449 RepID=UPI0033B6F504
MTPLDGNAIAGVLQEVFGRDVTAGDYSCRTCGRTGYVAELAVYPNGPGIVGRCRSCDAVLLMITERQGWYCVDSGGLS